MLENRKVTPVTITTGLSDGTWVEVAEGDLQDGDRVITDEVRSSTAEPIADQARTRSARWPQAAESGTMPH